MPFSSGAWSSPKSDLEAGAYCSVCLIDTNAKGAEKIKDNCKLPVRKTPGGPVNKNAVHAAAAALAGARGGMKGVAASDRRKAANKIIRLYREMGETAPESVYRIAGKKRPAQE